MALSELLTRPVAYYSALARLLSSIPAAVMLSQAIYWQERVPHKRPMGCPGRGWWYHTIKDWETETALTRHEQLTARKKLKETNFWAEQKQGIPARLWFKVDIYELEKALINFQFATLRHTSIPQSRQQDGRFMAGSATASRQALHTEITTRTTTETTTTNLQGESESIKQVLEHFAADEKQEEYLRLAFRYGAIKKPGEFAFCKTRQWKKDKGLSILDQQQVEIWKKSKLAAEQRKSWYQQEEQIFLKEDQQMVAQAMEVEAETLKKLPTKVRESLLAIQKLRDRNKESS
jgi:hypothetical protein